MFRRLFEQNIDVSAVWPGRGRHLDSTLSAHVTAALLMNEALASTFLQNARAADRRTLHKKNTAINEVE